MKGLYVHIPFCESICHYCDFAKQVPKNQALVDQYLDALIAEIMANKDHFESIETIYIGGGTPSMLTVEQLEKLFKTLALIKPSEYTIEVNPESYDKQKGELMAKYGVNRVSLGVQTFKSSLLEAINRKHQASDVDKVINDLREKGIVNISIDLIYAIPGQTLADLKDDLEQIEKLDIKHISCYSLILEDKTYFYHQFLRGKFKPSDQDLEAEMFIFIQKRLKEMGFTHYEISNYAKPGYASKHNLIYWTLGEYIGVGSGAHGFVNGVRTYNNRALNQYFKNYRKEEIKQTKTDLLADEMIFGLRKIKGVSIAKIEEKYQISLYDTYPGLKEKINEGLLKEEKGQLMLTEKGILLGNLVFVVFI